MSVPRPSRRLAAFTPYEAAGSTQRKGILLDANENAWGPAMPDPTVSDLHRYPEATHGELCQALARFAGVAVDRVAAGNGSDEVLDLILRGFADPGDAVALVEPTYGMYRTAATLNDLVVRSTTLLADTAPPFTLDSNRFLETAAGCRIAILCSPNNPTGNRFDDDDVRYVIEGFDGLVIVDEAYVEFGDRPSLAVWTEEYPNLCVLRTLSKAWGLAGIRIGYAVASSQVVEVINRIRPPYNVSRTSTAIAVRALAEPERLRQCVGAVVTERGRLARNLRALGFEPYPSDANFLLVPYPQATELVERIANDWDVRIRDRSGLPELEGAFRVTVGRSTENDLLVAALSGSAPSTDVATIGRRATIRRTTSETRISVAVELDGDGETAVATGVGFFDHMLTSLLRHAGFDCTIAATGDLHVDPHHTVEDVGIALGQALDSALGDRRGIGRYGFLLPMDESVAEVALDLSGRPLFEFNGVFSSNHVGELPTNLVPEFFRALAVNLRATLHVTLRRGGDPHHEVEACFKAVGRALGDAIKRDKSSENVPSTKGAL